MNITFEEAKDWIRPENLQHWETGQLNEAQAGDTNRETKRHRSNQYAWSQVQKIQALGFSQELAWEILHAAGPSRCLYAVVWALEAVRDTGVAAEKRSEFPDSWASILLLGVMKEMVATLAPKSDRRGEYKQFFRYLGVKPPQDPVDRPSFVGYCKVLDGALLAIKNYGWNQHLAYSSNTQKTA